MKRQRSNISIVKDDRAQALTETAIVMPVVMLFFLVILQYFAIIQAGQLGNYAAFSAARSYAVMGAIDGDDATNMATKAAAIALAPVARFVPNELFGVGGDISSVIGDVTSEVPAPFQSAAATTADLIEGYACAEWRLNSSSWGGGGSVVVTTSGSGLSEEVDVAVQYPQPVSMPGLAGLWNYLTTSIYQGGGGTESFATSMAPLGQGLGGVAGMGASIMSDYSSVSSELSGLGFKLPSLPPDMTMVSYVNIQSKCAIGYENWAMGTTNTNYMPRMHANSGDSDPTATSTNSSTQQAVSNMQTTIADQKAYTNAAAGASNACQNLCTADNNLSAAQARDNPIIYSTNSTPAQVSAAQADLQKYVNAQSAAEGSNTTAQASLSSARTTYDTQANTNTPSGACGCQ